MFYEGVLSNEYRKFSLVPGSSKCKKSEVHVLDSMGQQITDRRDLYTTVSNHFFYIMIISSLHYLLSVGIRTHDPNQGWGVVLIDFVTGPGPLQ
jgi:hypothetical protein